MTTPVEEMEEESLKALTEMFGSREEAIEHYDEMVEKAKADDIIWAATQYQRDRKEKYFHMVKTNNVWALDIKPEFPKNADIVINNNFKKNIRQLSNFLLKKIKKKFK